MNTKPEKPVPAPPKDNPGDEPPGPDYEKLGMDPNFGHSDLTKTFMGLGLIAVLVFLIGFAIWNG